MKLKYRGVEYEPAVYLVNNEPTGKMGRYRGVPYQIPNLVTPALPQPIHNLVYRGVPYQIGTPTPKEGYESAEMIQTIASAILEEERLSLKYQFHHPLGNH